MESAKNVNLMRDDEMARFAGSAALAQTGPFRLGPFLTWEQAGRVLRKNGRFSLMVAGLLILCVGSAAFLIRDVYEPIARLEVDPPDSGIKTLHEIEYSTETDNQAYLETQVQILQSDALAVSVIRSLHLDRNPEIVTKGEIRQYGEAQNARAEAIPKFANSDSFLKEPYLLAERTPLESAALVSFKNRLSISPVRNSRLIEVGFASHDPRLSQVVTNALVTQFIDQNYRNRYTTTMEASEWLSTQLNDLRQKVQESSQAVSDYQKKYGFVESDDRDVPTAQLMGEVNHQLSDAQANRIEAEAYVRMIDLGQSTAVPAVRDDQLYQNLMSRYVDVRAQLAQARAIYGDENSNVKKLQDELNEMSTQVEAERTRMVNRVRATYEAARDREQMMTDSREKLLAQMGATSSHMVAYRVLKNEAMASAELYNTLQARLKEAGIYAGLRSSNIHIVDLASNLSAPTAPHRGMMIAIGGIVSCFVGLLAAFVRESMDNTIRTPDDVRAWSGLGSLAFLPKIGNGNITERQQTASLTGAGDAENLSNGSKGLAKIFVTSPQSAEAEAIRDLRTSLALSGPDASPRVILITSSSSSEGKTTVAVNLAIVLAQRGKTCLVDADFRCPGVAAALGLRPHTELGQVLTSGASIDSAIVDVPTVPNLSVVSGGALASNPADLIASEPMAKAIRALREKFDYVVVDSPPVIPFSDARLLSSFADAVVLVSRYGLTTRRAIARSIELLGDVGAKVAGAVINGVDLGSPDYLYFNYGYNKAPGAYYSTNSPATDAGGGEPPIKKRGAHA